MKMTQLLWRSVSVWLCVAILFCRSLSGHVGSTEPQPEAQEHVSSQDIKAKEESWNKSPHEKNEENWGLPAQYISENGKLAGDHHHNEEQLTEEASGPDVPAAGAQPTDDRRISYPEQISEHQQPETSASQELDSELPPPPTDSLSVVSAPYKDDPSINTIQEDVTNRHAAITSTFNGIFTQKDAPEAAAPEAADFEVLPADCGEDEDNPYDDDESSPPIVLENTSNAHTTGTKSEVVPPLSSPAVHSGKHLEANASHALKEQDSSSAVGADTDSPGGSKDPEDIPTFDEWKRKMMEVEKEKTLSTHTSNNGGSHSAKKVQKNFNNYASVECGAKLLGANPEAKSTSAILKENMDLYMLNPCSTKIWFIIELCEPIQLKQLDIANFELFSSTPKDFLVSISDRYPTNKWLKLGTFHARDERTVQSFPLDEQLYAKYVKMFTKYIKVELVSHFGSEHFCPLSLIRVFGTSMVEEYEENVYPPERADDQDDDPDYPPGSAPGEDESKNLIGSAKDAIFNMVKDIAVVLGANQEMTGNLSSQDVNITEPSQPPETTTETVTTHLSPTPDADDTQVSPDSVVPATETAAPDTSATDNCEENPPPAETEIVIPLGKDEEEPISSTIILLDKEEEVEEDKDKKAQQRWHQESLNYCSPRSSSCSCVASFQEVVQQQCSASMSEKRTCQNPDEDQTVGSMPTPSWGLPPSACPEPPPRDSKADQSKEKEPASEPQPESDTIDAEAVPPEGSTSEPNVLEPSQTPNLPTPTPTESSSTKATPVVETPELSPEDPRHEPGPEQSQDAWTEENLTEPLSSPSSSVEVKPSVSVSADDASAAPADRNPSIDPSPAEPSASVQSQEKADPAPLSSSAPPESQAEPPAGPESVPSSSEAPPTDADVVAEPEPAGGPVTDSKTEDLTEEFSDSSGGHDQMFRPSVPTNASPTSSSLLDIYAEPFNGTEQNGNQVHGSSQKESVFMRLNNRIKALEVNMSLSGRYLEQLSQRYRKQMEEMQRAFNKTIIKLQNTSRIAEEQDLRQTESIQLLQGQLENVTQLVLNLSDQVIQLQHEVSDRQNYLLLSLVLCLCLGLLLCVNHFRITLPPTTDHEPPNSKSPAYCSPQRAFSSRDEMGLKRSASYPLINSETFHFTNGEGPEMLHAEEKHSLCPVNRKRRRRKLKPPDEVETLKPCFHSAPELCNGGVGRNDGPVPANTAPLIKQLLQPAFRDSPSEGSSEGSSHSDEAYFCGITTACSRMCDGLPPVKTRAEKRALRRRRLKPSCAVVDLLHAPRRDKNDPMPVTIQDIMIRKTQHSSGPFVPIPGSV
ncbi:SUN domain-containing ossification factor isoform X4 [Fundulus heteroclitus]|uniref:SUN domain-containing ossification factor isoform X4 n=1 Tax=Fundulus heteroclitus TaxID=8078 RepID=UPI00165AC791|nr:SUN domain-containing ossification factor isoform X4 [Fundulus heteroclitus]